MGPIVLFWNLVWRHIYTGVERLELAKLLAVASNDAIPRAYTIFLVAAAGWLPKEEQITLHSSLSCYCNIIKYAVKMGLGIEQNIYESLSEISPKVCVLRFCKLLKLKFWAKRGKCRPCTTPWINDWIISWTKKDSSTRGKACNNRFWCSFLWSQWAIAVWSRNECYEQVQ